MQSAIEVALTIILMMETIIGDSLMAIAACCQFYN